GWARFYRSGVGRAGGSSSPQAGLRRRHPRAGRRKPRRPVPAHPACPCAMPSAVASPSILTSPWYRCPRGKHNRQPDSERVSETRLTETSVILCVRNGVATIAEQLAALAGQDYSDHAEVVVVDNGSTDGTREL